MLYKNLILYFQFTVPDEVTGLNLTCALSDSELYYTCTAQWNVSV